MYPETEAIFLQIKQSNHILLHLHPGPDPDSIGSALAMRLVLMAMGKTVTVIKGDSDLPKSFSVFPGYQSILIKNWFELDLTQYDLFIALDAGGLSMVSKLGEVIFPEALQVVVVDHHVSNPGYGQINLIDSSSASTTQILFKLFKDWGVSIDQEIALCLFLGIHADTGGFRYSNTTVETLIIASELVKLAPDFSESLVLLNSQNSLNYFKFKSLAYSNIESVGSGNLGLISITQEQINSANLKQEDLSGHNLANDLISIDNCLVGVSLIEKELGQVYLSFRSREPKFEVSSIAGRLGGGGHKQASGALVLGTVFEVREKLLTILREVYPEIF